MPFPAGFVVSAPKSAVRKSAGFDLLGRPSWWRVRAAWGQGFAQQPRLHRIHVSRREWLCFSGYGLGSTGSSTPMGRTSSLDSLVSALSNASLPAM